jgi:hypothetical protein
MIQIVHHTRRRLLQGFAGAVLLGSAATAQSAVPAAEFVRQTAIAQMFGIESATLALHKSNSPAIKDFAHAPCPTGRTGAISTCCATSPTSRVPPSTKPMSRPSAARITMSRC